MRYPIIDTVRGIAILAMMSYHFGFDLNMQGYLQQDLNHSPSWLVARSLILSTFLFVSGFSLALAATQSVRQRWLRLARITGCAGLVSAASYFMFPESWIFFGVLHFVVIAGLLCRPLVRLQAWLLPLALVALAVGLCYQSPLFDQPLWQWLGLMTHKPVTEDYVPIFPWLGVVLLGLFAGQKALQRKYGWPLDLVPPPAFAPVAWLGRHSLAVYMLHQPLLLGLLWSFGALFR